MSSPPQPTAPTIDDVLALDITVPAPGFMNEAAVSELVTELATQNAILLGSNTTLRKTCEALHAQVDALKAHIREVQAGPANGVAALPKVKAGAGV